MKIALLPWGDVIEDFLDPIGISLERFRDEMAGGWLFGYVDALSRAGVDTVLVCVSGRVNRPCRWRHRATGAPLWVLPGTRTRATLGRTRAGRTVASYAATPLRQLRRVLKVERCGAILCQEYEYPRFDACVLLGLLLGLPVFGTFQGGDRHTWIERPFRSLALRACSGVVVAPHAEARRVLGRYSLRERKIARVFNPLEVAAWQVNAGERDAARRELGISAEARVVGWHGRVDLHNKGVDLLLRVWKALRDREAVGGEDRLLLLGTGPEADRLRRDIAELELHDVIWLDEYVLERGRIRRHLAAADIYAFPSRHEGFPVAPVEAMACGLPVVATAAPGVRDIFEQGEWSGGIVVPVDDSGAFGLALERLLANPQERIVIGRHGRTRAEEAFSLDAVGGQLREFLLSGGLRGL